MGLYIGIDPGAKGALCALRSESSCITFHETPNKKTTPADVARWIEHEIGNGFYQCQIGIEKVRSLPGMSARSNFSFGYNLGQVEAVLQQLELPFEQIMPKAWQAGVGITFPKGCSSKDRKTLTAATAEDLYPGCEIYGPRGGLMDGRADALMIAHFMSIQDGA